MTSVFLLSVAQDQRVDDLEYSYCLWQEIRELRDQLRDLMFYLEAQQTLASTTEATQQEIQDGQIIVQSPTASGHTGKKSRKKTR